MPIVEMMRVSEAIDLCGLRESAAAIDPYFLDRGVATHRGSHLIDLDERSLPWPP